MCFIKYIVLLISKTGIWDGWRRRKKKSNLDLEKEQNQVIEMLQLKSYSDELIYSKEIVLSQNIKSYLNQKKFIMENVWFK